MNPPSIEHRCLDYQYNKLLDLVQCIYIRQIATHPVIEAQMPSIQVHYISSCDRSSTMHIYTGGRWLAYQYITFVFLIDLAQYIYI